MNLMSIVILSELLVEWYTVISAGYLLNHNWQQLWSITGTSPKKDLNSVFGIVYIVQELDVLGLPKENIFWQRR